MSRYKLSPCNELPDKFLLCYHKVLDPQLFSISSKGQRMQWSDVVGDEVLKSVALWFGLLRSHRSLRWGLLGIGNLSSAFPEHQQWKPEGSWRFQAFYIMPVKWIEGTLNLDAQFPCMS